MLEIWPMWFKSKSIVYRNIIDIVDCKITYKKLLEASNWKPKINFNLCTESNTIKQYTYGLFLCSFFFTSTFILVFFYFSSKWVVLSVYFETRNFCFFSWSCIFFCPLLESCSYLVFLFDPPTIFRTQMIRNHDLPRWVFSNNQKKILPCLWYTLVTPPLHGLLLTVYTLQWNWGG